VYEPEGGYLFNPVKLHDGRVIDSFTRRTRKRDDDFDPELDENWRGRVQYRGDRWEPDQWMGLPPLKDKVAMGLPLRFTDRKKLGNPGIKGG
jgi:hypothetical protein